MIEASKRVMPWRAVIAASAVAARVQMHEQDVEVRIVARWTRPASHFTASGLLRKSSPVLPRYADCDKLARAVCDALAGIAYRNDRQVGKLSVERRWCLAEEASGAFISVLAHT
jgi:Holliday junction resolvase RusA-like endonuclease